MMLVLNRKTDQKIFITHPDGQITITVVEVRGSIVRIGIEAPASAVIERDDMKKPAAPTCWKCGSPEMGDSGGLCWGCFRTEQED